MIVKALAPKEEEDNDTPYDDIDFNEPRD